jgi:Bacterial PH domain
LYGPRAILVIVYVPGPSDPSEPGLPLSYQVPRRVIELKFALAAVIAVAGLITREPTPLVIALVVSGALAVYAVRDVVARERLRVDSDGLVVVHGFASRARLGWTDVDRVRVDERLRLGARTKLLEVDAGDWIGQYSRYELGAEPEEVVAAIDAVRGRAQP